MRKPVASYNCKHRRRIFLQSGHGAGKDFSYRYGIYVCSDCGTFRVFKEENGHWMSIDFTIGCHEGIEAAGQFLRWVEAPEETEEEMANPMQGMIDNRKPEQIEADGDDYWGDYPGVDPDKVGTLYTPPQYQEEMFWPEDKPRRKP